jgi:hypothetical protein
MACFASCPSCSQSCKLGCSSNADCARYGAGTCKTASCSSCRRVCSRAPTTCGSGSGAGDDDPPATSPPANEGCSYEVKKVSQCKGSAPEEDPWTKECVRSPSSCSTADSSSFPSKYCVGSCCTTFGYRSFRAISACP